MTTTLYAQLAPAITSSPRYEAVVGQAYTYDADADGTPAPVFTLETAPLGMVIDGETGVVSWTPAAPGEFAVRIAATNLTGKDNQEFTLLVSETSSPPLITSLPVTVAMLDQDYSYDVEASGIPEPEFTLLQAPTDMKIDPKTGLITWTPTSAGEVTVIVVAQNEEGSDQQDFVIAVTGSLTAPVITSTPPTTATIGQDYVYQLAATGDPEPTFHLDEAPDGMSIDAATKTVGWAPQMEGVYSVSIRASNEAGSVVQSFSIIVGSLGVAPSITSNPVAEATSNLEYAYDVQAVGNPDPVFSLGEAPEGMTIDANTGVVVWTPKNAGAYTVSIQASNELGVDTQTYTLTVSPPLVAPAITSTPVTSATKGQNYRYDVRASGNPAPSFSLEESPGGMTINTSGVVRWTPQNSGDYNVKVVATNSQGADPQEFVITVSEQPVAPDIVSSPSTSAFVGEDYAYQVEANGNPAPTFSLSQAPAGMTIDAQSGVISWTPEIPGGFSIVVKADNSQGSDTQAYTLTVNEQQYAPVIVTSPPTQSFVNQEYTYSVKADANPEATYALVEAPASMSINSATGVILWTPTQEGNYNVTVRASNALGNVTQEFAVTVSRNLAPPAIVSSPITQGLVSIDYWYDVEAVGNPAPVFALTEAPAGMSIDGASGAITWMPSTPGTFKVTVEASNSQGSFSQGFNVIVGILGSVPLVQLQSVRVVSPTALNLAAFANPNGSPTRVTIEYGLNSVDEYTATALPEVIEGFTDIEVIARLTGLEEGRTYSYRAVAENSVGRIVSATQTFTTYQSSYQIAVERPFSGSIDSLSYRLLSIPGNVDIDARETLQGEQSREWGVYADNGQPANYFVAYDGSERFHFKPGRGFWVLAKEKWSVQEQTVETVPLDPGGVYQITLQKGWNIIASPFTVSVPWSLVRGLANSVSPTAKLWAFNGAFREATTLEPYQAYYFFNEGEDGTTLAIPYPGLRPNAPKAPGAASKSSLQRLTLAATGFDSLFAAVEFLIDAGADEALDRLDQYAPRTGFSTLSLGIDPSFESPYGMLALEARPSVDEGEAFDVVLDGRAGERIDISIEGLEGFAGLGVFLADPVTGEFIDLHEQSELSIYPAADRARYRLLIGSNAYIDEQRTELAPQEFLLQQNYPNPFAGATTITYSLPEAGYVDLAVYDVLGREIQQLVSGVQPAGFHEVVWEGHSTTGASLPDGVYLLRMRTENGPSRVVSMTKVE